MIDLTFFNLIQNYHFIISFDIFYNNFLFIKIII